MGKNQFIAIIFFIFIFCFGCGSNTDTDKSPRQKINFDFDWKFSKGDFPGASEKVYDDKKWQKIDLPHDWSILDTFSKDNPSGNSGAFASGGIGWYRKTFTLNKKDNDSKISIEFGGVYMNSEVWINGFYLGKRPYGYISFNYDLTPYLDFKGENVLSVRVDNSKQPSARWYTGSGIYRHVWLITTNRLHIARHGVYITTSSLSADSATVEVSTIIENNFEDFKQSDLTNELYSTNGELIGQFKTSANISGNGKQEIIQNITVRNPELWSPGNPYLYTVKSVVKNKDEITDELTTKIGIRNFKFSADSGFSLNPFTTKIEEINSFITFVNSGILVSGISLFLDSNSFIELIPERA